MITTVDANETQQTLIKKPVIYFGVAPERDPGLTKKMFHPIANHLSKKLNITVKLETHSNFDDFWSAVHSKRYQLVHYNPYHYIRSHKELGYKVILKNETFGKDKTSAGIIVHKNSNIKSITDLKGKKVIFGEGPSSTFNYIIPRYLLDKAGLSPDMYQHSFGKNTATTVYATYYGQANASGSKIATLDLTNVKKQIDTSQLHFLVESEALTQSPWAISGDMSSTLHEQIQTILANLKTTPEGKQLLTNAGLTGLNKATDKEYDKHRYITWNVTQEDFCVRKCDYTKNKTKTDKTTPLVIGIFPRRSKATTLDMFSRLGRYLSYDLDRKIIIKSEKTFDLFWKNITLGKYDIVHYNQYQYLKSHKLYGYKIIAKNEERGEATITPAILVRNTSTIKNIKDLSGKKILFYGNRSAMISYIANTQLLRQGGLKHNQYSEKFASNPWDACEAAALGEADGCAVSTNCLLLNRLKDDRGIRKLKILTQGKPLPHLVWAVNKRISTQLTQRIKAALTSLHNNENGRSVLSEAWLTGIHSANDQEYDAHRKITLDVLGESY